MSDPWKRIERIGDATLYLGDCIEILPHVGEVDAVVTDPPYGINDAPMKLGKRAPNARQGRDGDYFPAAEWDSEVKPEWVKAVHAAAPVVGWFGHWRMREHVALHSPYPLRAEIVWNKDMHAGPPCPVARKDERIWLFSKAGITGRPFDVSVWDVPVIPTWTHKHHKNQKPRALMERLVRLVSDGAVLDPFMGSGTTGVACANLGRKFIGIELEEHYFDIACERIAAAYAQGRLFE